MQCERRRRLALDAQAFGLNNQKAERSQHKLFNNSTAVLHLLKHTSVRIGTIKLSLELKSLWVQLSGKLCLWIPSIPIDIGQKRHCCPSKPGSAFPFKSSFVLQIKL